MKLSFFDSVQPASAVNSSMTYSACSSASWSKLAKEARSDNRDTEADLGGWNPVYGRFISSDGFTTTPYAFSSVSLKSHP